MKVPIKNVQTLKNTKEWNLDTARQLGEALEDVQAFLSNMGTSLAMNPTGTPATPPKVANLNVTAKHGIYQLEITDNSPVYRPIQYFAEYSTDKNFGDSHLVPVGPNRTPRIALGNQTLHWRAYSQYVNGGPASEPVVFGNGITATPVVGGSPEFTTGNVIVATGPTIPSSMGAGINHNPAGGQGAGQTPYSQTKTGTPPKLN